MGWKRYSIEVEVYEIEGSAEDLIKRDIHDKFFDLAHCDQVIATNYHVNSIKSKNIYTSEKPQLIK